MSNKDLVENLGVSGLVKYDQLDLPPPSKDATVTTRSDGPPFLGCSGIPIHLNPSNLPHIASWKLDPNDQTFALPETNSWHLKMDGLKY